jgi:hypothetical protein
MHYVYRRNALEGETTLELTDSGIQVNREGGASGLMPYDSIVFVRLRYAPTRLQSNLFICSIMSRTAFPIEVHSSSYVSFGEFADAPTPYRAFVEALHHRLAAIGSRAEFVAGDSLGVYVANALLVVASVMLLVWVIGLVGAVSLTWLIVAKLLVIAAMAPLAWLWFERNRPRRYTPQAVPSVVLPTIA